MPNVAPTAIGTFLPSFSAFGSAVAVGSVVAPSGAVDGDSGGFVATGSSELVVIWSDGPDVCVPGTGSALRRLSGGVDPVAVELEPVEAEVEETLDDLFFAVLAVFGSPADSVLLQIIVPHLEPTEV